MTHRNIYGKTVNIKADQIDISAPVNKFGFYSYHYTHSNLGTNVFIPIFKVTGITAALKVSIIMKYQLNIFGTSTIGGPGNGSVSAAELFITMHNNTDDPLICTIQVGSSVGFVPTWSSNAISDGFEIGFTTMFVPNYIEGAKDIYYEILNLSNNPNTIITAF